jgi:hypothetical protein
MFLQNKYTIWYNNIISNAMSRTLPASIYTEKHHIVPKCLGGADSKLNIVKLTAKEHFICHLLLTKMLDGINKHKMIYAANRLLCISKNHQRYKINSTTYQYLKEKVSTARSIDQKGKPQTIESNKKRSATLRGRKTYTRTPEIIAKMQATKKANPQVPWNKGKTTPQKGKTYEEIYGEQKAQKLKKCRSDSMLGRKISEQTKGIWSLNRKGKRTLSENSNATPVTINGVLYGSKLEACNDLNLSLYKLNKLIS